MISVILFLLIPSVINKTDYCLSCHTVCASTKKRNVPLIKAPCIFIFNKPRAADENSMVACADLLDNLNLVTLIKHNGYFCSRNGCVVNLKMPLQYLKNKQTKKA